MTQKPEMIILSGLPGSGKSQFAKDWVSEDPDGRVRINYDDMRLAWFGPGWKFNRKDENQIKAAARDQVTRALNAGLSVIIDNTNLSAGTRKDWELAGNYLGATVIQHEIDTPVNVCVDRDRLRNPGRVGRAVIERMALFYGFIDWNEYPGEFVIVDLDGTVANCQHRLKYLEPTIHHKMDCSFAFNTPDTSSERCPQCLSKPYKNWVKFHDGDEIAKDVTYPRIVNLVKRFAEDYHILFVTGRGLECAIATEDWIDQHFIGRDDIGRPDLRCYRHLFMRPNGDHRADTDIKREILNLLPKDRIAYVLEDRDRVVEMYRAEGLTVLQPKKGDY